MVKKAERKTTARTRTARKTTRATTKTKNGQTARKVAKATTKTKGSQTTRKKKRNLITYNTPIGDIAKKYGIPLKPGMSPDMKVGDVLIADGDHITPRFLKKQ